MEKKKIETDLIKKLKKIEIRLPEQKKERTEKTRKKEESKNKEREAENKVKESQGGLEEAESEADFRQSSFSSAINTHSSGNFVAPVLISETSNSAPEILEDTANQFTSQRTETPRPDNGYNSRSDFDRGYTSNSDSYVGREKLYEGREEARTAPVLNPINERRGEIINPISTAGARGSMGSTGREMENAERMAMEEFAKREIQRRREIEEESRLPFQNIGKRRRRELF